jgi:type III secretory pathway component EscS
MGILGLIIVCVIVGLILWLVNNYVPMQPQVKQIMNVLVIIALVIYFVYALLGGFASGPIYGPGPYHY